MLAELAAALSLVGLAQAGAGAWLTARFSADAPHGTDAPFPRPPGAYAPGPSLSRSAGEGGGEGVTVLKPLYGAEPLLEAALATLCAQTHPPMQIVCGVARAEDPAAEVVRRLTARFPDHDIALVVDARRHGTNGKVSNLINMLPAAKHDVIVIADSDVHAAPDYLARLLDALAVPGTGLATTLYAGLPATDCLAARMGATQITHGFLPGAVLSRALGRQDCLGATMALRRETLARIGGLEALADHLADDNALGRLVAGLGLQVGLAATVPLTTVPETSLGPLLRHELRWARTIRALAPVPFAASVLQYPIFWALAAVALSGGAAWAAGLFAAAWAVRAALARWIDRSLAPLLRPASARVLAFAAPVWLLPLRDLMSVLVLAGGFAGSRVVWRGHEMTADGPVSVPAASAPPADPPAGMAPQRNMPLP
ncbi:MAG: bacteriohopanetetrol glucosamine biosynthesis glycosyltransferase HpnI [Proteobacteria bacterium]|nr:bacteriohopanetetrol glucosamine biosynthesis glycosyltransferase HpnI [Pseudomonadota bacterium]